MCFLQDFISDLETLLLKAELLRELGQCLEARRIVLIGLIALMEAEPLVARGLELKRQLELVENLSLVHVDNQILREQLILALLKELEEIQSSLSFLIRY